MSTDDRLLTQIQIRQLAPAFHHAASAASVALAKWLNAPTTMTVDSVDQCRLEDVARILGDSDATVCISLMEMEGTLTGHMLLAFDDASGLALSDLLLSRPPATTTDWGELEISCVLETMNIAGSAYLNGIARDLSDRTGVPVELIPTPPRFHRDFAESILQGAFQDQALAGNEVVFGKARFDMSGRPLQWTFLLIPDPRSLERLSGLLRKLF